MVTVSSHAFRKLFEYIPTGAGRSEERRYIHSLEVDDEKRFLLQFIANLQREDISPLEEATGIRQIIEQYGYPQHKIARLFNKSKSYISQILGLERLSERTVRRVPAPPAINTARVCIIYS